MGGVAISFKSFLQVNAIQAISLHKQPDLLAMKVQIAPGLCMSVAGCYRPPFASSSGLQTLKEPKLDYSAIILKGDSNWDWLSSASDDFKSLCDFLNHTQTNVSPTRPKMKCQERSTVTYLILTNVPHKYSATGVFCHDLSNHCAMADIRNTKLYKGNPQITIKRDLNIVLSKVFILIEIFATGVE